MPINMPTVRPDLALVMPESGANQSELLLTNGQVLSDGMSGQFYADNDDYGRYITPLQGVQTLNLAPDSALEHEGTASEAFIRVVARNITPFWDGALPAYTSQSAVSATLYQGGVGLAAQRQGVGEPEYVADYPGGQVLADSSYREVRVHLREGERPQYQVLDAVEGDGIGLEGEGEDPTAQILTPAWVFNLNLNTNPAQVDPERVRLYRLDVWVDPGTSAGVPPLRHRQNALNSGGPPLRHRQNGGQSGGPLLRHRQTGL